MSWIRCVRLGAIAGLLTACTATVDEPEELGAIGTSQQSLLLNCPDPGEPAPGAGTNVREGTLKILQYNTFQRVTPAATHDPVCRAQALGILLRNSDADVIVLEETFDSEAVDALAAELVGSPFEVRIRHRPDQWGASSDGGLTVVSRLPMFAPFSQDFPRGMSARDAAAAPWRERIFDEDDSCIDPGVLCTSGEMQDFPDSMANKGVIWFQVEKENIGRINIVASHTQANTNADALEARRNQFELMGNWIRRRIDQTPILLGQPLFIVGDLNIDASPGDVFDNETQCDGCPRHGAAKNQDGTHIDGFGYLLRNPSGYAPTNLFNQYAATFDSSCNHGAIMNMMTYGKQNFFSTAGDTGFPAYCAYSDWDNIDYQAHFDWIAWYDNSDLFLVLPDEGYGPKGVQIWAPTPADANQVCETPGYHDVAGIAVDCPLSGKPMTDLSDHYGVSAYLNFWKVYDTPPGPVPANAPARPTVPTWDDNAYWFSTLRLNGQDVGRYLVAGNWRFNVNTPRRHGDFGEPTEVVIEKWQKDGAGNWALAPGAEGTQTVSLPSPGFSQRATAKFTWPVAPGLREFKFRSKARNPSNPAGQQDGRWSAFSPVLKVVYETVPPAPVSPEEELDLGNKGVHMTWAASNGATVYVLTSSSVTKGTRNAYAPKHVQVYAGPALSYRDKHIAGGIYAYTLRACKGTAAEPRSCSEPRTTTVFVDYPEQPDAPELGVSIFEVPGSIGADGIIRLAWDEPNDATGKIDRYEVQESTNPEFSDPTTYQLAFGTNELALPKPFGNALYYYRIRTCKYDAGAKAYSCQFGYTRSRAPVSTAQPKAPVKGLVAVGGNHSCSASAGDGKVKCWGQGTSGQLGNGASTSSTTPVVVSGLSKVRQLALGFQFGCALLDDATVKCWGHNGSGQLGDGTTLTRTTPVLVSGLSGVAEIAAGAHTACARTIAGEMKCWGSNGNGQIGDGTTTNRTTPTSVSGLASGVASMGLGASHTCARLADGTARCWGYNGHGQLGDGTTVQRTTPVVVSGLAGAISISGGGSHTCALAGGIVACWGRNTNGQLGDGTTTQRTSPVSVLSSGQPLSGASHVLAMSDSTCAAFPGGFMKCWGKNTSGQLGDGTTTQRTSPVDALTIAAPSVSLQRKVGDGFVPYVESRNVVVQSIDAVPSSSSGSNHMCVAVASTEVRCWGINTLGTLGDGTTTQSSTAVGVTDPF